VVNYITISAGLRRFLIDFFSSILCYFKFIMAKFKGRNKYQTERAKYLFFQLFNYAERSEPGAFRG
jgi:hypothetical protein